MYYICLDSKYIFALLITLITIFKYVRNNLETFLKMHKYEREKISTVDNFLPLKYFLPRTSRTLNCTQLTGPSSFGTLLLCLSRDSSSYSCLCHIKVLQGTVCQLLLFLPSLTLLMILLHLEV